MNNMERVYKIYNLLNSRGVVSTDAFLQELDISLATFKRDLAFMKNNLNAPIEWDSYERGYKFGKQGPGPKFELHGMWFSQEETTALVTMNHLLASLDQGGLIGPHIAPLMTRIDAILGNGETSSKELRKRIKLISMGSRKNSSKYFADIGNALLKREMIQILFYTKDRDEVEEREVSPQRLIHYRENWYLDAYCHKREALRSFSLDGIRDVVLLNEKCKDISDKDMNEHFTKSYGIFSGGADKTAKLKFSPKASRWVSGESWHPEQRSHFEKDGSYVLEFEYSQDPELIMDILKHGDEVEVLAPADLKKKVISKLENSLKKYAQ
ncbi:YafY family protein [Polynucleobacter sp. AM-26B4]|uniref:helix-turn-helix transcriptional regulator n=1 Tax=Polynucleobacter sp. AM-26B4 TaxID=2689103 RepID=UPI001C0E5732|nr:YafY family protein [Polynucleobacter sp. AM-26B4]MBU3585968.1 YafY family transcriptional regulator [Polynucleobacter sp. AM-26B4]